MQPNWHIRAERETDREAVEKLADLGFGPGRFAKTAYRLREGVAAISSLSFVAENSETGALLGAVQFWPVIAGDRLALLLGPLAVEPRLRGRGIGVALMQHGIAEARKSRYDSVILVGDETYYSKAGFAKLQSGQVRFPGPVDPNRILGLALKEGALERLSGEIKRACIDVPVSAQAAKLG
jgi:predicted N-acetyltransferase YhbS